MQSFFMRKRKTDQIVRTRIQGPVVQNVANMTLKFLPSNMANTLILFAAKMWAAFALQKLPAFLQ